MSRVPRPTTRVAVLPSAGYGQFRLTKHTYVDTRECRVGGKDGDAWEHIFRCEETGEERRWGVEPRHVEPVLPEAEGGN